MRGRGQSFEQEKEQTVAVAIDKDRGSEYAIKWAVDSLLTRGQALTLLHVRHPIPGQSSENQMNPQAEELFVSFRSFCAKKNIKCTEIVLEDTNIPNALIKYVKANSIEFLVLGVPTKGGIFRFKLTDVPSSVIKMTPDFCSVCVIAKGKISYMRCATVALPVPHPPSRSNINHQTQHHRNNSNEASDLHYQKPNDRASEKLHCQSGNQQSDEIKSPFSRGKHSMDRSSFEISSDMDISFVSSARPSAERRYPSFYDHMDSGRNSQQKLGSETENRSSVSSNPRSKNSMETNSPRPVFSSSSSDDHSGNSSSSQNNSNLEDVELEMRRLKLELKQTMGMYRTAFKEALNAKDKESELNRCKMEEGHRLEEARLAEEAALTLAEREKAKCKAAVEAAAASQRLVELEAQKRRNAEIKSVNVSEDDTKKKTKAVEGRSYDVRYRRYSIEEIEVATGNFSMARKIGEGGYGPVYRGELDHTPVAIKVLRPDSAQGRSQFQQEVEVLSCIRHPNMVLLLGACPEYGCLVYEYMASGSLEDRLFHRGNTRAIPWQVRFRIATEIATGLLFLHQAKPEPLVHRDLKPGNILLDNNYVSKISDVGLARLVPPSVANSVTQYHMTSTAGTFCYIDPEYQQTGMLGAKSDIYSLGVMLLQIITAKPPMGLTHHVERAIEIGTFSEMLDPAITDWPVEEALNFAKLSLQCAEMRKKDRPDLGKVVLPELNRLRAFAEESLQIVMFGGSGAVSLLNRDPNSKSSQDVISRPPYGYDSSRSRTSSTSSNPASLSG